METVHLYRNNRHQLIHERCDESKGVFSKGDQEKLRSDFQNTRRGQSSIFLGRNMTFTKSKIWVCSPERQLEVRGCNFFITNSLFTRNGHEWHSVVIFRCYK